MLLYLTKKAKHIWWKGMTHTSRTFSLNELNADEQLSPNFIQNFTPSTLLSKKSLNFKLSENGCQFFKQHSLLDD